MAGLDGCRAGWVVVRMPADAPDGAVPAGPPVDVSVAPTLAGVVAELSAGTLVVAAADVPMGLATQGLRVCDVAARRLLGPRRSSVFPAPARAVLAATDYAEACRISRDVRGKAVSVQLFNIIAKIREADRVVSPTLQDRLFEMHPELSFTMLAGAPMRASKRTPAGRAERVAALQRAFGGLDVSRWLEPPPPGAGRDDVLDAFAGAWTARRYAAGAHMRLGGDLDERGLRMEIIA